VEALLGWLEASGKIGILILVTNRARGHLASVPTSQRLWAPWQLVALVLVTTVNYVWQVPYFLHFYGQFGKTPGGLAVPLLLTFVWFVVGTVMMMTKRRGGVTVMASFLTVEALFYLVHYVSGAGGRDLFTSDAVLFIASALGL
jgi:hypothetical protein